MIQYTILEPKSWLSVPFPISCEFLSSMKLNFPASMYIGGKVKFSLGRVPENFEFMKKLLFISVILTDSSDTFNPSSVLFEMILFSIIMVELPPTEIP